MPVLTRAMIWRFGLVWLVLILALQTRPAAAHHARHYHHMSRAALSLRAVEFAKMGSAPLIAAARTDLGRGNFTGLRGPWCAAALNVWLRRSGYTAPHSNRAIDFARYGRPSAPHEGAIAVLRHHVGIVIGWAQRRIVLLSGNHRHRVGIGAYDIRRIVAWREPV